HSAIQYSLDNQSTYPIGGNILITNEGIIIYKWFYNEWKLKRYKHRFPKYYFSSFILGIFDFLHVLFSNFGYLEDLKLIFTIKNLKGWIYTSFPDEFPVDIYWEASSNKFKPYEFECKVKQLSSSDYKLGLVKDKIMKQILLELGCDEEFQLHPEIIGEYR
ncbi:hypothetical protein LCGC14_1625010, partial [marine sediment metagenome]